MNEQLDRALSNTITKILSSVDHAQHFIVAETPDVIQQIMTWHFVSSLMLCVLGLVLMSSAVYMPFYIKKRYDTTGWNDEWYIVAFCSASTGFVGIIISFCNFAWFKIWITPKAWIIEYAATII